ncbi:enoyl-CoA hydratase [Arthrobacter tumbae]|uniref:enoyl-CoA hydratase/isomerase family protein n=1 Tax=Arthrobacter tumbae TaxID=163874 RepID=UPI0019597114|nr:enoyl-CoA hydratase-related protein [Arthrobacter tumbae]MBM7781946.1 enoyl-CoA hydratase/carnithine racemase [Arthrobacter tumbae]
MAYNTTHASQLVNMQLQRDVALVTIEDPPLNLLSRVTKEKLRETFIALKERSDIRAVVLRGAGTRAFSAGADIREFPQRIADGNAEQIAQEGHQLVSAIANCGKPTIALVEGVAYGAGLEVTLATDLRFATERASFALPEVTRGVFPGNGGTQLLPRIIGPARALELMLTGKPIDAVEAHRIGLVNRLIASGDPLAEALSFAEHLASLPTTAISRIRRLINAAVEQPLAEGLKLEAALFGEVFRTDAVKEGIKAFQEKRPPNFRGTESRSLS